MTPPAPQIEHGLETPVPLAPQANYLRLEGWALVRDQAQPTQTRLTIDDSAHSPSESPTRPDVAKLFPTEPHAANTGFIYLIPLRFGNYVGVLEVSGDGGRTWHLVRRLAIPVSSHPLLAAFEPAGADGLITSTTRLAGWVWHPEFRLRDVVLLFDDIEVPLEQGLERADVGAQFPNQPGARFSGFITRENLPRGRGKIRLKATTACGRVYFFDPKLTAELPTGAYAPPRPPPEMWDLSLASVEPAPDGPGSPAVPGPVGRGPNNLLFVLYGDFTSNSAHHVTAIANALIGRGYDCIVAVPAHPETIGAQPHARFLAIAFDHLTHLPTYYRDGQGPAVVHAWTTRENVRRFTASVRDRFDSDVIIHLEDNERLLLAAHLNCTLHELAELSDQELADRVPAALSHPRHATDFLNTARGATVLVETLREFVPPHLPILRFWPAAISAFRPRPRNLRLRRQLGISDTDIVVFYHGNVHAANHDEVRELYLAVRELNQAGTPTWLIRTGRDHPAFTAVAASLGERLIHAGFVKRGKDLPALMSMADYFVQPGGPGPFNDYRFPSKLPEFFALGRPVILPACNLGAHVRHGHDAYVLDPADAASIRTAIEHLQRDQTLRDTLAAGAVAFAQAHFSWPTVTSQLIEFYHQSTCLERPAAARILAAQAVTAALPASALD